jgi:hypothetical protein
VDPLRQEYLLHCNRHIDFSAVRFTGILRSLRISPTLSYSSHGQHFRLSRLGYSRMNHLGQRLPQTVRVLRAAPCAPPADFESKPPTKSPFPSKRGLRTEAPWPFPLHPIQAPPHSSLFPCLAVPASLRADIAAAVESRAVASQSFRRELNWIRLVAGKFASDVSRANRGPTPGDFLSSTCSPPRTAPRRGQLQRPPPRSW